MNIAISGILFDGPYSLSSWDAPGGAAVYSVLYKQEGSWNVTYVGETSDLDERCIAAHHERDCWIDRAGSESSLHIAVYPMPNSTEQQRKRIQVKIKFENEPPCND